MAHGLNFWSNSIPHPPSEMVEEEVEVLELTSEQIEVNNKLVEEIHETFYSEVDRLLAESKILNSIETEHQELMDKSERLKSFGFKKTKEVEKSDEEVRRLGKIKDKNAVKESLTRAIEYFSGKYPLYKFITKESVEKICDKYGLVYGDVSDFIGDVPEENLRNIENFKIDEEDECHMITTTMLGAFASDSSNEYMSSEDTNSKHELYEASDEYDSPYIDKTLNKANLEIAAPIKDFDMTGKEVKGFEISKIQIPDPVVLQPVIFEGMKHYLIVTAWGKEASDPLVMNPVNN